MSIKLDQNDALSQPLYELVAARNAAHDRLSAQMRMHGELLDVIVALMSRNYSDAHETIKTVLEALSDEDSEIFSNYMSKVGHAMELIEAKGRK